MAVAAPPRSPHSSAEAARPAPRGSVRDLPRVAGDGRIRWDRVGRIALLALLGVVLLLYVAPLRNWLVQSRTADAQRSELRALEREQDRLEARARDLARESTLEREARRLGMVRRGERGYVIQRPPKGR
jgi:cell division protein FtsB